MCYLRRKTPLKTRDLLKKCKQFAGRDFCGCALLTYASADLSSASWRHSPMSARLATALTATFGGGALYYPPAAASRGLRPPRRERGRTRRKPLLTRVLAIAAKGSSRHNSRRKNRFRYGQQSTTRRSHGQRIVYIFLTNHVFLGVFFSGDNTRTAPMGMCPWGRLVKRC